MNKFNLNDFKPNQNYVLEASAGTGKTFTIVEMVRKLVDDFNIPLEKILIVTYTEKAAGELKNRIREKLPGQDINKASIGTIHSFCQNTISEFGLTGKLPFSLTLLDDSALNDYAQRFLREGNILKDINQLADLAVSINFDDLEKYLVQSCKKYYLDINYKEDRSIVSLEGRGRISLELFKVMQGSETIEDFSQEIPDFGEAYSVFADNEDQKCRDFARDIAEKFESGHSITFDGRKFRQAWFDKLPEIESEALSKILDYKEFCTEFDVTMSLANIYLEDFYKAWQEEKNKLKAQTFDDMIRFVRESIIHNPDLLNKLREKYSHGIIDEFQDTNQKQYDIFGKLFLCDNHYLTVVGDPKQSIYSFQGADIEVYKSATEAINKDDNCKFALAKNYRSTKDLVEACNALFSVYDFKNIAFEGSDYIHPEDEDDHVKEHRVTYCGNKISPFLIATDDLEKEHSEGLEPYEYAKIVAQQILDFCQLDENGNTKLRVTEKGKFRNVSFKDFTILARTSTEMPPFERALKNAGIPYVRYKDKGLFSGKECADWIAIFNAIDKVDFTGENRKSFKKALFTNFFGLSLKEISDEKYNRDDLEEIELIKKWKLLAFDKRYEDLVDDILMSSNLNDKLASLSNMQSLSIYKQIGDFCIEFLSKNKGISQLVRRLTQLSNGASTDGEEEGGTIVRKGTDFDCVQIMTIHASKGLSFPIVFSAAGFKQPYLQGKAFTYHRGSELKLIMERLEEVSMEELEEWKRLFYVAYTRPIFLLVLPIYRKYGAAFIRDTLVQYMESAAPHQLILDNGKSYKQLSEMSAKVLSNTVNEDKSSKDEQDKKLKKIINLLPSMSSYKHSYSSLSHGEGMAEEEVDEDDVNKEGELQDGLSMYDKSSIQCDGEYDMSIARIEMPNNYPRGSKIGTALHEVFELSDFENYEDGLEELITSCFLKQTVKDDPEWINKTKEIVRNVLNAKLPVVHGSKQSGEYIKLSSISLENKRAEVEFNFNLLNQNLRNYCNGFVDLIFKNGEYFSILDWKSDSISEDLPSYNKKEDLKHHVDNSYSIQRVLYSYCLIMWLKSFYKDLTLEEIFEKHFGGVYYVFLKGCNENTTNGVYVQTWSSWNDLKQEFDFIIANKIGGKRK